jgi:hypothetical protein
MKANPENVNGPETMVRLDAVVRKVLSVSHDEIVRREAEYGGNQLQTQIDAAPNQNSSLLFRTT